MNFTINRDPALHCEFFRVCPVTREEWNNIPNPDDEIEDIVKKYASFEWGIYDYQKPPKRYRQFDYDYKKVAIINGTYGGESKTDWFFDNKIRCVIYSFSYGDLAVDYIDPYTNRGVLHIGLRQHIFKP